MISFIYLSFQLIKFWIKRKINRWWSTFASTISESFFFLLRLVYPVLPFSLDCPFLIATSVFTKVYSTQREDTGRTSYWNLVYIFNLGQAENVAGLNQLISSKPSPRPGCELINTKKLKLYTWYVQLILNDRHLSSSSWVGWCIWYCNFSIDCWRIFNMVFRHRSALLMW